MYRKCGGLMPLVTLEIPGKKKEGGISIERVCTDGANIASEM